MPTSILRAVAEADTGVATAKLGAFGKKIDEVGRAGSTSMSRMQVAGRVAFAGIGVAAIEGIGKAVEKTVELGAETRKLSRELGLTAEDASRLRVAGETLGLTTDDLSRGFGIFSKNLINGAPNLEKYGIEVQRTADGQVDFLKTLDNVSDAFVQLPPGVDRTAFAMNVFGRSGKDLIPILSQGSAGLEEMYGNAQKLGLVMSEDDLRASRELAIAQRELHAAFEGVQVSLARAFLPVMKEVADALTVSLEIFNKLPGPVKSFAAGGLAVTGVLVGLGLVVRVLRGSLAELGLTSTATATATEGLAAASGTAAGAIGAETAATTGLLGQLALMAPKLLLFADVIGVLQAKDEAASLSAEQLSEKTSALGLNADRAAHVMDGFRHVMQANGNIARDIAKDYDAAIHGISGITSALQGATVWGNNAAAAVAAYERNLRRLGSGRYAVPVGGSFVKAQHGFHGMVSGPTIFLAGEGPNPHERVDITPGGAPMGGRRPASSGSSIHFDFRGANFMGSPEDNARAMEAVAVRVLDRALRK